MRLPIIALFSVLAAGPALAAEGPFVSLKNTNFIVLLAFLLFLAILVYYKVPGMVGRMLDERSAGIRKDLDEARRLRDEAQTLLGSFERKQREVDAQASRIVAAAKEEAEKAAVLAMDEIRASVARRLAAAHEQIASAEARAIRDVRDEAITVAVNAARDVIAQKMTPASGNALIDDAISAVEAKLH